MKHNVINIQLDGLRTRTEMKFEQKLTEWSRSIIPSLATDTF